MARAFVLAFKVQLKAILWVNFTSQAISSVVDLRQDRHTEGKVKDVVNSRSQSSILKQLLKITLANALFDSTTGLYFLLTFVFNLFQSCKRLLHGTYSIKLCKIFQLLHQLIHAQSSFSTCRQNYSRFQSVQLVVSYIDCIQLLWLQVQLIQNSVSGSKIHLLQLLLKVLLPLLL